MHASLRRSQNQRVRLLGKGERYDRKTHALQHQRWRVFGLDSPTQPRLMAGRHDAADHVDRLAAKAREPEDGGAASGIRSGEFHAFRVGVAERQPLG